MAAGLSNTWQAGSKHERYYFDVGKAIILSNLRQSRLVGRCVGVRRQGKKGGETRLAFPYDVRDADAVELGSHVYGESNASWVDNIRIHFYKNKE